MNNNSNLIKNIKKYYLLITISIFIMLFFIKDIVLLKPFFSYIVAIHEFCHAFATIITGGNVHQIMLYQQGGHALTSGGFFPLIAISGYIGTTLIGAILIYFSINDKINKYNLRVLSISIFLIYLFYYKISFNLEFLFLILMNISLFLISYTKVRAMFSLIFGNILILESFNDVKVYLFNNDLIYKTDSGILARYIGFEFLTFPIALFIFIVNLYIIYLLFKNMLNKKI